MSLYISVKKDDGGEPATENPITGYYDNVSKQKLRSSTLKKVRNLFILLLGGTILLTLAGSQQYPKESTAFVKKVSSHFRSKPMEIPFSKDPRILPPNAFLSPPVYTKNEKNGLYYPASQVNTVQRGNAALVSVVRNSDLDGIRAAMKNVEDRFNRRYRYPWVFMSAEPFTEKFKEEMKAQTRSEVIYHEIPASDWDYPNSINQTFAADERRKMQMAGVSYGGSENYRKLARFNSGFFYRQSVLESYDYYWRVESGIELYCDLDYDPFLFMAINKKLYGFITTLHEVARTIENLWSTVQDFVLQFPEHIAKSNSLNFLLTDPAKGIDSEYNLCHFWSNFEIGDLRFYRSKAYTDYFDYLDATGNFFYERWGDAPVHSVAAALFLPTKAVHQFEDIGFRHASMSNRPSDSALFETGQCIGNPDDSAELAPSSCQLRWWDLVGRD